MSEELLSVERLERLRRQEGVEVRPTLLRVLTDLYIQKPHHAPEEIERYQELALQLLETVDAETRAIVARKLADEPRAPFAVVKRLLEDEYMVAAPVLARYPLIPHETLLSIALDGGAAEARAVAARSDLDADMARILARHPDDLVVETLAANGAVKLAGATLASVVARARINPALASTILLRWDFESASLAPLYLMASPERRAAIRDALAARAGRAAPKSATSAADAEAIATAIEIGDAEMVADTLSIALDLKPADAAMLVTEASGEGFVLALRAAGCDSDLISRALLTCQPEIAKSVVRFFDLVEIAESASRPVAAEIVAAMVGADAKAQPVAARHEPALDPSGVIERAGAARAAPRPRRQVARPEINRNRG